MKFIQLLSAAGLAAYAQAWGTDISTAYTTVVTTAYETYCPVSSLNGEDLIQETRMRS